MIKYSFLEDGIEMVFAYHEGKFRFRKMTRDRFDLISSHTLPNAKKLHLAQVSHNRPVITVEMAKQMDCPFMPWEE